MKKENSAWVIGPKKISERPSFSLLKTAGKAAIYGAGLSLVGSVLALLSNHQIPSEITKGILDISAPLPLIVASYFSMSLNYAVKEFRHNKEVASLEDVSSLNLDFSKEAALKNLHVRRKDNIVSPPSSTASMFFYKLLSICHFKMLPWSYGFPQKMCCIQC